MELNISRTARAAVSLSAAPSGEAPIISLLDCPLTLKEARLSQCRRAVLGWTGQRPVPTRVVPTRVVPTHESSTHEPLRGHPRRQASQLFNCLANHLAGHIIRDFHVADRLRQNKMDHSAPGFFIREDKP